MKRFILLSLVLVGFVSSRGIPEDSLVYSRDVSGSSFLQLAMRYWVASLAAYCPGKGVKNWSCYYCKDQGLDINVTHVIRNRDILVFTGYNNEEIIISFRGTIGPENWLTDVNLLLVSPWRNRIKGAAVHQGFYIAYLSIQHRVRRAAIELSARFPNKTIVVTGHSLGAGLATIATADLFFQPLPTNKIQLWTYGSPRVGNVAFATFMDRKLSSYRIVNKRDYIPALPPNIIGLPYRHINREYWFHSATNYTACRTIMGGEDLSCSDSLVFRDPKDHSSYMGLLKIRC